MGFLASDTLALRGLVVDTPAVTVVNDHIMRHAWATNFDDARRESTGTKGMTVLQDVLSRKDTARKEKCPMTKKWLICAEDLEVAEDVDCCMLRWP